MLSVAKKMKKFSNKFTKKISQEMIELVKDDNRAANDLCSTSLTNDN